MSQSGRHQWRLNKKVLCKITSDFYISLSSSHFDQLVMQFVTVSDVVFDQLVMQFVTS